MKIHIIGIAGKTSSALAKMLLELGHEVVGSDQGAYPPTSTYLNDIGVTLLTPYNESNLAEDTDLVIVAGNALIINPQNPEYLKAVHLGLKIVPFSKVLEEFVIKKDSIVVVGNYGKGTISGAIVKVLSDLGENPSYMVGGQLADLDSSLQLGNGRWSVVEGDEYPDPPIDDNPVRSKFFHYHPKYLIITSAEWDHFDKFPTLNDYIDNYVKLIETLPRDGLVVANYDGEHLKDIISHADCRVVTYSLVNTHADYVSESIGFNPRLFGRFNLSNITAAYAMLAELGFDRAAIIQSLNSYQGLKHRLSIVHEDDSLIVVRDLAHSPIKAKSAISAVAERWPEYKLVAVLDIFSTSLKNKAVLSMLSGALDRADIVYIPRVKIGEHMDREETLTGKEILDVIKTTQPHAEYVPKTETLVQKIKGYPGKKVVLLMSSGGMDNLDQKLVGSY